MQNPGFWAMKSLLMVELIHTTGSGVKKLPIINGVG